MQPMSDAALAWAATQGASGQAVLEDFIRRYGDNFYGTLARARLDELNKAIRFKADLTASHEVPPTTSVGSGTLEAVYDTAKKQLTYTVTYSGLTGPATAAHFHAPAASDANAGVVVPVLGGLASPIKGTATLSNAQASDLLAGRWYFNIHTDANKRGRFVDKW
jgi:hypothetical protein